VNIDKERRVDFLLFFPFVSWDKLMPIWRVATLARLAELEAGKNAGGAALSKNQKKRLKAKLKKKQAKGDARAGTDGAADGDQSGTAAITSFPV
jgi:hypothetical protein